VEEVTFFNHTATTEKNAVSYWPFEASGGETGAALPVICPQSAPRPLANS